MLDIVTVEYGSWFDYVRGMEKEIDKGDYAIHVVYYEDMKEVTLMFKLTLKFESLLTQSRMKLKQVNNRTSTPYSDTYCLTPVLQQESVSTSTLCM